MRTGFLGALWERLLASIVAARTPLIQNKAFSIRGSKSPP
jgi:hypothetical protein